MNREQLELTASRIAIRTFFSGIKSDAQADAVLLSLTDDVENQADEINPATLVWAPLEGRLSAEDLLQAVENLASEIECAFIGLNTTKGNNMNTVNEWGTEANELDWVHNGMRCHIQRVPTLGHLCGYVEVPRTNAAYKKDYDDVDFDVHGGLTFAAPAYWYSGETAEGLDWWLGFDCGHQGDLSPGHLDRGIFSPTSGDVYCNMAYVKDECERLADQIAAYVEGPKSQYIVIGSNVVDGLTFFGPFADHDEAVDWAESQGSDFGGWNITTLNPKD